MPDACLIMAVTGQNMLDRHFREWNDQVPLMPTRFLRLVLG
jgi:hypothetical protein